MSKPVRNNAYLRALGVSLLFLLGLSTGCATTPKIDWENRVGTYTFDDAVLEFGPPDNSAELSDGSRVADWLIYRGSARVHLHGGVGFGYRYGHHYRPGPLWGPAYVDQGPNQYLRLTFNPEGILRDWQYLWK